jgi:hypothetical protein
MLVKGLLPHSPAGWQAGVKRQGAQASRQGKQLLQASGHGQVDKHVPLEGVTFACFEAQCWRSANSADPHPSADPQAHQPARS